MSSDAKCTLQSPEKGSDATEGTTVSTLSII